MPHHFEDWSKPTSDSSWSNDRWNTEWQSLPGRDGSYDQLQREMIANGVLPELSISDGNFGTRTDEHDHNDHHRHEHYELHHHSDTPETDPGGCDAGSTPGKGDTCTSPHPVDTNPVTSTEPGDTAPVTPTVPGDTAPVTSTTPAIPGTPATPISPPTDAPAPTATNGQQPALIPAYWNLSDTQEWQQAIAKAPKGSIFIMNDDNGPGATQNANIESYIKEINAAGDKAVGYVDTKYGADSLSSVESQVQAWDKLYPGIDGNLFDEASYTDNGYYSQLYNYMKSNVPAGANLDILNGGVAPNAAAMSTADILTNYEGQASGYNANTVAAMNLSQYTPAERAKLASVIYGGTSSNLSAIQALNAQNGIGYTFVTDQTLNEPSTPGNPYYVAPSWYQGT